jgi:hypothetical protein
VEMYKKAYDEIVYPMSGNDYWIKTNYDKVDPPLHRIQFEMPKKVRTRGLEEPRNPYRMRKGEIIMRCSRCKATEHTARTCPQTRRKVVNYR